MTRIMRTSKQRSRSSNTLDELLKHHHRRVQGLAYHVIGDLDASFDIAQETFFRVLSWHDRVRDKEATDVWLTRIAVNLCRSYLRHENVTKRFTQETQYRRCDPTLSASATTDAQDAGLERLEQQETHAHVRREVRRLPKGQRLVVILRDMMGLTYEEVADILAIPIGTVRSRLHKARDVLRERLVKAR